MRNLKPRCTPEQLATMVELLPSILSLRDLCAITGLRLDTVRRETAPFRAIMKLQGVHPQCGCGRDRFHPYGCTDSHLKIDRKGRINGRTWAESEILLARRAEGIKMLERGDRLVDVDAALNMGRGGAKNFLHFMTEQQLEKRKRLQIQRGNIRGVANEPSRPFSDPLYARISSAVPRWLSPALREDVISEIYVAVMDGDLPADAIEANAKRFAGAATSQFESKWGPRSLDASMYEDGNRTLADVIPDPSALAAFDHLDSMRVGRRQRAA